MFRQIIEASGTSPYGTLSTEHPRDLLSLIEACWESGGGNPAIFGRDSHRVPRQATVLQNIFVLPSPTMWDHLIYAYLVENTRIYEIFRRVIWEYRNGEKLGPLSPQAVQWLQNTEELFYTGQYTVGRSAPISSIGSPDWDAARRNAYFRLFGYDLNHGAEDNRPAQFTKPQMANKEFSVTLEILLHEIWKGITNARNTSGKRDTDDAELANLTLRLFQMLTERKSSGKLVREEFWSVTAMSWLHMAVEEDSPIVVALQSQAASAEERLRKIGQIVGIPPHAKTQAFLLLSRNISQFLREVELGSYSQSTAHAQALYQAPAVDMMQEIISLYSVATGKDLKAKQVNVGPIVRPQLQAVASR